MNVCIMCSQVLQQIRQDVYQNASIDRLIDKTSVIALLTRFWWQQLMADTESVTQSSKVTILLYMVLSN